MHKKLGVRRRRGRTRARGFAEVMQSLEPSKGMITIIKAMLKDAWNQRLAQANTQKADVSRDITQIDKQLDG